jgi:hypothetical protein
VIEGLKNLQRDPGSSSVDLLGQISQQSSVVLTFPDRSLFRAPVSALVTNALWLLNLIVSLFVRTLATLLQQWAHRCLPYHPKSQLQASRSCAGPSFFFRRPKVVEALPALFHMSFFFFFSGPLVYVSTFITSTTPHPLLPNPPPVLLCVLAYSGLTFITVVQLRTKFSNLRLLGNGSQPRVHYSKYSRYSPVLATQRSAWQRTT